MWYILLFYIIYDTHLIKIDIVNFVFETCVIVLRKNIYTCIYFIQCGWHIYVLCYDVTGISLTIT